jgi:hypothetical protein
MVWVWCRGGVVKGMVPEFLEELVRSAAEQDSVEKRDAVYGRFGLLLVGDDPVKIAVSSGKITFAVIQLNITIRRVGSMESSSRDT